MAPSSRWTWVSSSSKLVDMLDHLSGSEIRDLCIIFDVLVKTDTPFNDSLFISYIPSNGKAHLYVVDYAEMGKNTFEIRNKKGISLQTIMECAAISKALRNTYTQPAIIYMRYWVQMAGHVGINQMTAVKRDRARLLWDEVIAHLGFDLGLPLKTYQRQAKLHQMTEHIFVPHTGKHWSLPIGPSHNKKGPNNSLPKADNPSTTRVTSLQKTHDIPFYMNDQYPRLGSNGQDAASYRPYNPNKLSAQSAKMEADADEEIVEDIMVALCYRMALAKRQMGRGLSKEQPKFPDAIDDLFDNDSTALILESEPAEDERESKILYDSFGFLMKNDGHLDEKLDSPKQSSKETICGLCPSLTSSRQAQHGSIDRRSHGSDHKSTSFLDDMEETEINSGNKEENKDDFEHVSISSENSWDMLEEVC